MSHLIQQQIGKLCPSPVEYDPDLCGSKALAQSIGQQLGLSRRRHFGVVHVKRQHCMVSWVGFRQSIPRSVKQFLTPAPEKGDLTVRLFTQRLSHIGRERLGLCLALSIVIGHEVDKCRSEVIAKASGRRVGPAEIPAEEAQGKFLEQF
jgi:hypothetical protein